MPSAQRSTHSIAHWHVPYSVHTGKDLSALQVFAAIYTVLLPDKECRRNCLANTASIKFTTSDHLNAPVEIRCSYATTKCILLLNQVFSACSIAAGCIVTVCQVQAIVTVADLYHEPSSGGALPSDSGQPGRDHRLLAAEHSLAALPHGQLG